MSVKAGWSVWFCVSYQGQSAQQPCGSPRPSRRCRRRHHWSRRCGWWVDAGCPAAPCDTCCCPPSASLPWTSWLEWLPQAPRRTAMLWPSPAPARPAASSWRGFWVLPRFKLTWQKKARIIKPPEPQNSSQMKYVILWYMLHKRTWKNKFSHTHTHINSFVYSL